MKGTTTAMKLLTVHEVSELTGVSVRALHHYDAIGLLRPVERTRAGYRLYGEGDLARLQQIMLFRELEFPLKEIKAIISEYHGCLISAFGSDNRTGIISEYLEHGLHKMLCVKVEATVNAVEIYRCSHNTAASAAVDLIFALPSELLHRHVVLQ